MHDISEPLLRIESLITYFFTDYGVVKAINGVDLEIDSGETLGVVGESGCGKSVTALSVLRLIPCPPGRIVNGKIFFSGRDLLGLTKGEMRKIRGNEISMIFQDPMVSLNPVFTVGNQIIEPIVLHQGVSKKEAKNKAVELLHLVGIPNPGERIKDYPHQLSGGMQQRVMIAMALSCRPRLLIADEPTTALDVTIQAQILDLLQQLQEKLAMSLLLITHDLAVVAQIADRVAVMYAGEVVEQGTVEDILSKGKHPYTRGLIESIPSSVAKKDALPVIKGQVPHPVNLPDGCPFHPRCNRAEALCRKDSPKMKKVAAGHWIKCHLV